MTLELAVSDTTIWSITYSHQLHSLYFYNYNIWICTYIKLPTGIADLATSLANVDRDALPLKKLENIY